jgi:hypothetical protein
MLLKILPSRLVLLTMSRHGQRRKYLFPLLLYPIAVETSLFVKPLLINGCLCLINLDMRAENYVCLHVKCPITNGKTIPVTGRGDP